jgi:ATP-dependent Lon protease
MSTENETPAAAAASKAESVGIPSDALIIVPVRQFVLFPGVLAPIAIARAKSQLGDVMRESAQAAMTLVKSRAAQLGIDSALFEKSDIHVHVPAGATPKDGPSAGVAMFTALASLLTNRTVRNDTAMTGEISLRGLVLPVGGIKEKVVAAAAAGLTRVMLPARNRRDFDDIPQGAREKLEFVWLENVDEAVANALAPKS